MMKKVSSFKSTLKRIADGINYFAIPVPLKITQSLNTRASIPVIAQINGAKPFRGSFYTVGEGRHGLRVKASVRAEAMIQEGDAVHVKFEVVNRAAEVSIPLDLRKALRAQNLLKAFNAIPLGKKSYTLRWIKAASKPETRKKRIEFAIATARKLLHQMHETNSKSKKL
jgi:hypothetical protein